VVVGQGARLALAGDNRDAAAAVAVAAEPDEVVAGRPASLARRICAGVERVGRAALATTLRRPRHLARSVLHVDRPVACGRRTAVVIDYVLDDVERPGSDAVEVRTGPVLTFFHGDVHRGRARRIRAAVGRRDTARD